MVDPVMEVESYTYHRRSYLTQIEKRSGGKLGFVNDGLGRVRAFARTVHGAEVSGLDPEVDLGGSGAAKCPVGRQ